MTSKARVLFVDDEKRVLNSMRGLFRRDFELFLTTEGTDAIKIAAENPIDVIVADQRMPGMTGTEVLGKIKKLSPRTVRILLTGYADPTAVEGSINIGEVFRFLSKPCPPKLLRETLELAIAAARATPEVREVNSSTSVARQEQLQDEHSHIDVQQQAPRSVKSPPAVRPPGQRVAQSDQLTPSSLTSARQSAPTHSKFPERRPDIDDSSSHWQSVTEVVLSGDTSQEVRQLNIDSNGVANTKIVKDVGAVIYTVDSQFAETAIRAIADDRSVVLATTLAKVAEAIERRLAGVLVTDFTTKCSVLQKMIGELKQHLPELVTIVVSDGRDTTDMINLINYGQIFRYIMKPVERDILRHDINAAAVRHQYLRTNPQLAKRHEVVKQPEPPDTSETLSQFLTRVRNLRNQPFDPTDTST